MVGPAPTTKLEANTSRRIILIPLFEHVPYERTVSLCFTGLHCQGAGFTPTYYIHPVVRLVNSYNAKSCSPHRP